MSSDQKFAYSEWSWGIDSRDCLKNAASDLAQAGFHNIELVRDFVNLYQNDEAEFHALMKHYDMTAFSFYFMLQPDPMWDVQDMYEKIDFIARAGAKGLVIQGIWDSTPANEEDLTRQLKAITAFADTAKQYDMTVTIHPHHNTKLMYESDLAFILNNTDPDTVGLCPDFAHLCAARIDPVRFTEKYVGRIYATHFKDMADAAFYLTDEYDITQAPYANFRELGKGSIDLCRIIEILKQNGYRGYQCVELDSSPTTNLESAKVNYDFLKQNW